MVLPALPFPSPKRNAAQVGNLAGRQAGWRAGLRHLPGASAPSTRGLGAVFQGPPGRLPGAVYQGPRRRLPGASGPSSRGRLPGASGPSTRGHLPGASAPSTRGLCAIYQGPRRPAQDGAHPLVWRSAAKAETLLAWPENCAKASLSRLVHQCTAKSCMPIPPWPSLSMAPPARHHLHGGDGEGLGRDSFAREHPTEGGRRKSSFSPAGPCMHVACHQHTSSNCTHRDVNFLRLGCSPLLLLLLPPLLLPWRRRLLCMHTRDSYGAHSLWLPPCPHAFDTGPWPVPAGGAGRVCQARTLLQRPGPAGFLPDGDRASGHSARRLACGSVPAGRAQVSRL